MVCVKEEGVRIDFDNDPIPIRLDRSSVSAEGTTLGADNGIGVAYSLAALIDPQLSYGPLEALLTVDEEDGATGALGLQSNFFSGDYLLNLDSEEAGIITIGTAGYEVTEYTVPVRSEKITGSVALSFSIGGLAGGHSGIDIHLARLNAIRLAIGGLDILREAFPVRIGRFEGGEATNSIPARAACTVLVPTESKGRGISLLEMWREQSLSQFRVNEPGLEISINAVDQVRAYTIEQTDTICQLLKEIPHGPLAFSKDIEGLVESSNNLARVKSREDAFEIKLSCRSSVELDEVSRHLRSIGEQYGVALKQHSRLPGWTAKPASPFSRLVQEHYRTVLGRPVSLKAYHAGLECGIFMGISSNLEMASIGPEIRAVHTPEENVEIPSVALLWEVLSRIIAGMGELRKIRRKG
jgi:dipeptidase D